MNLTNKAQTAIEKRKRIEKNEKSNITDRCWPQLRWLWTDITYRPHSLEGQPDKNSRETRRRRQCDHQVLPTLKTIMAYGSCRVIVVDCKAEK